MGWQAVGTPVCRREGGLWQSWVLLRATAPGQWHEVLSGAALLPATLAAGAHPRRLSNISPLPLHVVSPAASCLPGN